MVPDRGTKGSFYQQVCFIKSYVNILVKLKPLMPVLRSSSYLLEIVSAKPKSLYFVCVCNSPSPPTSLWFLI